MQDAPAATCWVQVVVTIWKTGGLIVAAVMLTGAEPLLVKVTTCVAVTPS